MRSERQTGTGISRLLPGVFVSLNCFASKTTIEVTKPQLHFLLAARNNLRCTHFGAPIDIRPWCSNTAYQLRPLGANELLLAALVPPAVNLLCWAMLLPLPTLSLKLGPRGLSRLAPACVSSSFCGSSAAVGLEVIFAMCSSATPLDPARSHCGIPISLRRGILGANHCVAPVRVLV